MNENETTYLRPVELSQQTLTEQFERVKGNDRGEPLTWGATPLLMTAETTSQQAIVKKYLSDLFNKKHTPRYIPRDIVPYVEGINMAHTARRESLNTDSYLFRGTMISDSMPIEVLSVIERALRGSASPAELLFVAQILEIPTIELASLTHPYGQRIDELKPMRRAVNEAIVAMGGELVDNREARHFEVKGSDNHINTDCVKALEMTRKTEFGNLPDATSIVERSSFVVLVHQLPKFISDAIKSISYGKDWAEEVGAVRGFDEFVVSALGNDQYRNAAPVSTTVVARNPKLEERLLNKDATQARRRAYTTAMEAQVSLI